MSPSRPSNLPAVTSEEPTPKPASAVTAIASSERSPESSQREAERRAAFLDDFANPPPEMRARYLAWEEGIALYGDEDSDAWLAALEDGTHPLCRVGKRPRWA